MPHQRQEQSAQVRQTKRGAILQELRVAQRERRRMVRECDARRRRGEQKVRAVASQTQRLISTTRTPQLAFYICR